MLMASGDFADAQHSPSGLVDQDRAALVAGVMTKTAPAPMLRFMDQAAGYRIAVHVAQLFDFLLIREDYEVIEARLPDVSSGNGCVPDLASSRFGADS